MSQCVPSWDLDDSNNSAGLAFPDTSSAPDDPTFDYEVAELTWENGQLAMHGLGPPRPAARLQHGKYSWEKPRAGGTLESIVDQATCKAGEVAVAPPQPWFEHHQRDATVPCSSHQRSSPDLDQPPLVASSTRVKSCSGAAGGGCTGERIRLSREQSTTAAGSAAAHVTVDTCEMDPELAFTSTSLGSQELSSLGKSRPRSAAATATADDHDSVSHSHTEAQRDAGSTDDKKGKLGISYISTKRSRAAAIHNQSERKRRDRINQRMKTLQKLVPNSSKTDKASMLDEVIEYLKQLQAQVQMMSKMSSIPHMLMPIAMQQLQMSMMAQMGMGMGMGHVMDLNSMNRATHHVPPPAAVTPMIHPAAAAAFLPLASAWDGSTDRLQPPATFLPGPFSAAFQPGQPQPMNFDAFNRMAALYQHLQQATSLAPPNSKA